jgi:hypothetical protein
MPALPLPRFRFYSVTLPLLCLLILSSSCAAVRKTPYQWPVTANHMEGSGDMDLSWRGRSFSGSFALQLESPSMLLFEVYGPFGQTLLQVKKKGERVDIMTGEGRTESEKLFEEQYGMGVDGFIDDLMMRGMVKETAEGNYIDRTGYKVLYTSDGDRPRIRWLNPGGLICLTFTELVFARDGRNGEGSRK